MTNPRISRQQYGLLDWVSFFFFFFFLFFKIHYQGVIQGLIRLLQGFWAYWEAAGVLLSPCRGAGLCVLISLASSLLSRVWIQPGSGSFTVSTEPEHPNTFVLGKSSNLLIWKEAGGWVCRWASAVKPALEWIYGAHRVLLELESKISLSWCGTGPWRVIIWTLFFSFLVALGFYELCCSMQEIQKSICDLPQDLHTNMYRGIKPWARGLEYVVSSLSCANLLIPCLASPLSVLQTSKRRWLTDKWRVDGKRNTISMWPLQSPIWSPSKWSWGSSRHSDRRALSRSCLDVSERSDANRRGIPPG